MEIPKHHYIQQYLSINTIINIKYTCTTILTGNPTKSLLENKLFIYQTKWGFPKQNFFNSSYSDNNNIVLFYWKQKCGKQVTEDTQLQKH